MVGWVNYVYVLHDGMYLFSNCLFSIYLFSKHKDACIGMPVKSRYTYNYPGLGVLGWLELEYPPHCAQTNFQLPHCAQTNLGLA